jgi:sec-independent protein translocase protein TatC
MKSMERPAKVALDEFYRAEYEKKAKQAQVDETVTPLLQATVEAGSFITELKKIAPKLELPQSEAVKGQTLILPLRFSAAGMIETVQSSTVQIDQSLVSLAPLETLTIFFMVGLVSGLVVASPWVFYQGWAFVAAGLYRHERRYVKQYLPFSLGLFLTGVFLCFLFVLPVTLKFLLQFNVWLGVAPTLRLSEWMGFATILPLIFGLSFQTPLIMLFVERIGILTIDDFRAKRKIAILVITVAAAVLTPGQDPFSMLLLACPMIVLYEIGILLIGHNKRGQVARG